MIILYLHQYFNTPDMSGGTRSYEMARRFVEQGHKVYMITSWREPKINKHWFQTVEAGINVFWLPVEYSNEMSFYERTKAFFRFAYNAAIKASDIQADIIFATSTPLTIALPAVYASKKNKIPMVFEIRDLWPELPIAMGALNNPVARFLAKKLEIFAYENASSIVALSPGMKEGVVRTSYPNERVAVIPNSSDLDMFQVDKGLGLKFRENRVWLGDKPLLLYTGTFGLINGVSYLVDLALELSRLNSNVRILAIGGGIEFDKVIEQAKDSGVLNHNLFIEGYLKKKDIPGALSAATIASALFVDKPEMRPNSANKFFDSLAAGKPIMINYGGWMHDLIQARGCGLAMWDKPIEQVAQELNRNINDVYWLENASKAALRLAEESFSRDILAKQLLEVLLATKHGEPEHAEIIAPGYYGCEQ